MNPYVKLAKEAVESYVKDGEVIALPTDLDTDFYDRRAGVFVTLIKDGQLRACLGTTFPVKNNIAGEIVSNAIAAATQDPRFGVVEESELASLSYEVHILTPPMIVNELEELDPNEYGIIVTGSSGRSALLLPGLEGIDTPKEQLETACNKAGIDIEKEDISMFRFQTEQYVDQ
ncbi:MAG: AmmeMemoRadiSam system protein A [Patescibacteria group bacterium]